MRIGDYDLIRMDGKDALCVREGRLYRLLRCDDGMTADRADAVAQALGKAILPGSNTVIPAFFEADTGWYCAVPWQEEIFRGLPLSYLRHLPEKARMHLALLAVSALETVHQGGVVHGSLTADCFRLTVTPGGVLCPVLMDLRHAGTKAHPPLCPDRASPYASPEARNGKAPTAASDVFALGLCLHLWFAGELPRCRNANLPTLARNTAWLCDDIPEGVRSVIAAMLEASPADRPALSEVFKRLRSGTGSCPDPTYPASELPEEDRGELRRLLLLEHPLLTDRYKDA